MVEGSEELYTSFTVTYNTPISNDSGDDIAYEVYSLKQGESVSYLTVCDWLMDLREIGGAVFPTSEGLLYLQSENVVSIMFHEEEF